jgi:hypothetical protein
MSSPFADFANFVADFEVGTAELGLDRLGNPRPVKSTIRVTAAMKASNRLDRMPRDDRMLGNDGRSLALTGFVVSPLPLPRAIAPDSPCVATLNGIPGRFAMQLSTPSPYTADVVELTRLRGIFTLADPGELQPLIDSLSVDDDLEDFSL